MAENRTNGGGGIGLCGFLFLIFLVLKLCGVIDWSWWLVTSPLWIPVALCGVIAFVATGVWLVLILRGIGHILMQRRGGFSFTACGTMTTGGDKKKRAKRHCRRRLAQLNNLVLRRERL